MKSTRLKAGVLTLHIEIKIDCADSIVRTINSQSDNSIKSLDIVSHGTPISLNFSVIEDKNCGLYTSGFSRTLVWLYAPFDSEVNSPDNRSRKISEIDFAKFTEDARAEFHGCNAASWNPALNSLVEEFSKNLFSSGKTRAVSIGHTEKANPKIYGDKTTIPQQDYRHGERAIYHNERKTDYTDKTGYISDDEISAKLN